MSESTLSLDYDTIAGEVSHFLGYGRTSANWTTSQANEIDIFVQSVYRKFLQAYAWSFLRINTTLATVIGTSTYAMPDNFGGFEGDSLTYAAADNRMVAIQIVPEEKIRELQQVDATNSGYPVFAAVRSKASTQTTGQRSEILLWPTPDAIYTLTYAFVVLQDKLTTSAKYPLGGAYHGETVLCACLAVAETRKDQNSQGPMNVDFALSLKDSIEKDRTALGQANLGYNGDGSSERGFFPWRNRYAAVVGY